MIITSLPITFQAALEAESFRLTQRICWLPRKSRGWFELRAPGHDLVAARLVVAVAALVEQEQLHRLAEAQRAVDPVVVAGVGRRRLEERSICGRATLLAVLLLGREAAAGRLPGVVVLHLVVVPDVIIGAFACTLRRDVSER